MRRVFVAGAGRAQGPRATRRVAVRGTIVLLALAAAALAAPVTSPGARASGVAVTDDHGERVALAAPARRIVSLAPHATELLFAAGAGAQVVGVIKGSDAPPAAQHLPVVGDVVALDLERIVALAPDLIVTWPYTTPAQVALLKARGIAVFVTDAHTVDAIAADLVALGTLAGTQARAMAAARRLRERAAALRVPDGVRRVKVFYQVASNPAFTIGAGHLIDHAIDACGGVNVFADASIPAPQVGLEGVLARQPEAIVAGTAGARRPAWLDEWRAWPQLPAVRLGNLFVVDADLLHRPGPRFADGMAQLCAALAQARARLPR